MSDITASVNKFQLALDPNSPDWPSMIKITSIPGLLVYQREMFKDERGFFKEVVEIKDLEKVFGQEIRIVQWNHSHSLPGVIRGIHAEPWDKLVYAMRGRAQAVIVDLRVDSPSFGKAEKFELHQDNALFIPEGLGNSFCVMGDERLDYSYIVTGYYEGKPTPAINVLDPMVIKQVGNWPVTNPIINDKDRSYPSLQEKFKDELDLSKYPWLMQK